MQVEVELDGDNMRFVSLYAPNTNPARNTFLSSLPDLIDLAAPTFVCGDFNSVLDPHVDRRRHPSYAGPSERGNRRESVAALQSLLAATETFPVWRTRHPTEAVFSWDHASGLFSSRINMIWAPMLLEQTIKDCCYHPSFLSDHCYMLLTFELRDAEVRGCGSLMSRCWTIRHTVPSFGPFGPSGSLGTLQTSLLDGSGDFMADFSF